MACAEPAQGGDAARAGDVGDGAHAEEEGGLGDAVAEHVEHAAAEGHDRSQSAEGDRQEHVAEVRDRGLGQQALQVVLDEVVGERDEHRDEGHRAEQRSPSPRASPSPRSLARAIR